MEQPEISNPASSLKYPVPVHTPQAVSRSLSICQMNHPYNTQKWRLTGPTGKPWL